MATSLIHMYSRIGFIGIARSLFNDMPFQDMGSWNAVSFKMEKLQGHWMS